jgi:uncharacterized protein YbjT (DUF2867 family)
MFMVTGATGTVGRPLVELLAAEGAKVRDVTRTPHAAALPAEVEVVGGDPSRPDTIASALFLKPAATDAPIHERDVAGAAVLAMLAEHLAGRRLRLTGPRPLTREETTHLHRVGRRPRRRLRGSLTIGSSSCTPRTSS